MTLRSRPLQCLLPALLAALAAPAAADAAAKSPSAAGAPTDQVAIATAAALAVLAALAMIGLRVRAGRTVPGLALGERLAVAALGVPGWAAVPVALATGSLLLAVFGLQWDVSYHIDNGRDPGPLANPSHYFILVGLLGIFAAGWLALVLPRERPGPAAMRIVRGWSAPVGGVLMVAGASFASLGFPLDDLWHRLFGQDVTLWGPTHLMMLTGALVTIPAIMTLLAEGRLARDGETASTGARRPRGVWPIVGSTRARLVFACGGLLAGLSIYQGEFDYGVPQFRLLLHPLLIALAASVALVAARLLAGRGGALGAALFFVVLRGALTLIVTGALDRSVSHFPLYLAEAALVEGLALWLACERRPLRFALAAGGAIGTVGVLAEWGWSHVWMLLPWPAHLLPSAIAFALPAALAGAVLGAFLAGSLRTRAPAPEGRVPARAAAIAVAVVAVAIGVLIPTTAPRDAAATLSLSPAHGDGPGRWVNATVRPHPDSLALGVDWFVALAWQGHRHLVDVRLRRVAPGTYITSRPLPVSGSWKTVIRLHRGSLMASVPVYLPSDPAIPAPEVRALPRVARPFTADHVALQRERRADASGALWHTAIVAVLAAILALLVFVGWALQRVRTRAADRAPLPRVPHPSRGAPPPRAPAPAGAA